MTDLASSYQACQQAARQSASNFYWSFRWLPADKRRGMYALYAFARRTDDLGDSVRPASERMQSLVAWRHQLSRALAGDFHGDTWPALADTVQRYAIPHRYLFDILDGVQMDVEPVEFESFEELRLYCYRVASAVGLACLHIWGYSQQAAVQLAIDRGIAFQLTNILRDIGEDARRDRVYVPREDLRQFSCDVDDLQRAAVSDRVLALLRYQVTRAESYYRRSKGLLRLIHPDGHRMLRLMTATYWHLLHKLEKRPERALSGRTRISSVAKLGIIHSAFLPWGAMWRENF